MTINNELNIALLELIPKPSWKIWLPGSVALLQLRRSTMLDTCNRWGNLYSDNVLEDLFKMALVQSFKKKISI